jgi:hypothetical protein
MPVMVLLLVTPLAGAGELQPFAAGYTFSFYGITVGDATLRLQHDADEQWTYNSTTEPRGLGRLYRSRNAVVISHMEVSESGVRPLSYLAEDGSDSKDRDSDLRFDWSSGRVTGVANAHQVDMQLPEGTQDDLSVQVALMHELIAGRTPATFRVFDEKGVREYRYYHEGSTTLDTPLGKVATEIYRSQRDGSPRATRFWCAPDYGYLPMRAEQRRLDKVEWTLEIRRVTR